MKKRLIIFGLAVVLCGCGQKRITTEERVFMAEGCARTEFFTPKYDCGIRSTCGSHRYWKCPDGEHYSNWKDIPKYKDI